MHGTTTHGAQFLNPILKPVPLTYYSFHSPIGRIMTSSLFDFKNIAVLGLGTGGLSAYFKNTSSVDYFEIDKDMYDIAETYFTFIPHSSGKIDVHFGDARLLLNQMKPKKYDIIIADAFSGDSIPIHLLTKEAMENYHTLLNEKGIILFHVSNRYIRFEKPLSETAYSLGARVCFFFHNSNIPYTYSTRWVAVTWDEEILKKLVSELNWVEVDKSKISSIKVWTDQYSSFLPYIDYQRIWQGFKNFDYLKIR